VKPEDIVAKTGFLEPSDIRKLPVSRIETFAVLPSKEAPRWMIPLENRKLIESALVLYQPSLPRAKLLKQLTILLAGLGLSRLFMRDRVRFNKEDEEVRKIFDRNDLHYAIFTGTEGCHRKITVQVMDGQGTILGYIKVSDSKDVDRLLENEAGILRELMSLDIKSVLIPKVLYQGNIKDVNMLVFDTLKSIDSAFSNRLSESHIMFLTELFQKTATVRRFVESGFAADLKKRVAALEKSLSDGWKERYENACAFLDRRLGDKEIPFGLCHRDFTPWNTFFHAGKLYVFDWEYAAKDYPPLLDVFHFIVQDGILVRHLKPEELMRKVIKNKKWLSMYSSLVGIKESLVMPLLICYLLDISLLYIEREEGKLEPETLKTVETWGGMMDLAMTNSS
jgi:hypothetical protein